MSASCSSRTASSCLSSCSFLSHRSDADICHDACVSSNPDILDFAVPDPRLERLVARLPRADDRLVPLPDLADLADLAVERAEYTDGAGLPVFANQQSLPLGRHFFVSALSVCFILTARFAPWNKGSLERALSMCGIFMQPGFGGFRMLRAETAAHQKSINDVVSARAQRAK